MFVTQLRAAVGHNQPNQIEDVRLIQKLLNRNSNFVGLLDVSGVFDLETERAVLRYKREVMHQPFADDVIRPRDGTFWRLSETRPRRILAGAMGGILLAPVAGESQLSPDDFTDAAQQIGCERRAVMAVAAQEASKAPFDQQGRPTILFERNHFSRYTLRRFDGRYPAISNPVQGGYLWPEPDQYKRLQLAFGLDAKAALLSTSWGAFQILGSNFEACGYCSVEDFVRNMCHSVRSQLDAFVAFVKADSHLLHALRSKDWQEFAVHYNGPDQSNGNYAREIRQKYEQASN